MLLGTKHSAAIVMQQPGAHWPSNAVIGADNSHTRSQWAVQVKLLTNKCWQLSVPPSTPALAKAI